MSENISYLSEQFMEIWDSYEVSLKQLRTRKNYLQNIKRITNYLKCDFLSITPKQAQQFFTTLEQGEKNYSPKYLHSLLSACRSVAKYIETNRDYFNVDCYTNPFKFISLSGYSDNITINDIPSPKQIDEILALAQKTSSQLYVVLCLSIRCGISTSQICNLKANDIMEDKNGSLFIYVPKIGNKEKRYIKIPEDIQSLVTNYCASIYPQEYMFLNKRGSKLHMRTLQGMVHDLMGELGYNFSLQDIRNACIAYMQKGGATATDVADYVGISKRWMFRYNKVIDEIGPSACDYNLIKIVE